MKIKASLRKTTFRTLVASFGLVAAVGVAACATTTDSDEPEPAAETQQADAHHQWRGPVGVVVDAALANANLTDEQATTLRDIGESMKWDREDRKAMGKRFKTSAIEIVRAGNANSEQFEEAINEAAKIIEERMLDTNDAIKEVHATLDADQRADVADALRERIKERFDGDDINNPKRKLTFKRFTKHLALTTLQIDKLKALRTELNNADTKRFHPSRDELLALVDAFEGDDFATTVDAFHADKIKLMRAHLGEAGETTNTVLSILNEGQRELLADLIDQGPKKVLLGQETH